MTALHELPIRRIHELFTTGKLSPVELVKHYIQRIEDIEPTINAYAALRLERALEDARIAESEIRRGECRGDLHGIPIGLKDIIEVAGVPTTAGSRIFANYIPSASAVLWNHIEASGAILMGKLRSHEFASGGPERLSDRAYDFAALNPWNGRKYTGGSSSGCASAVAAGLCMGAVGSDTGGSIRIPSAYCGIFGLKPTYGLVSSEGVFPVSQTLDHCGPMTWTADDASLLLAAMSPKFRTMAGGWGKRQTVKNEAGDHLPKARIGVISNFFDEIKIDPSVNKSIIDAIEVFSFIGHDVIDIRLPHLLDFTAANTIIFLSEAASYYRDLLIKEQEVLSDYTRQRLVLGGCIFAADYLQARRVQAELTNIYQKALASLDAVVCPCTATAAGDAETAAKSSQKFFFLKAGVPSAPFNLVGAPAASICCGFDQEGMPIALQLAGGVGRDADVLNLAIAYEEATSWRRARPM
jgi:aspartyl-tRNA(Asn)/glutamyl-tRNA(Gln) amidotransferase subunit A